MEKYGNLQLFPVKIQVPLIMSLRATLHVKNIKLWGQGKPSTSRSMIRSGSVDTDGGLNDYPANEFWEPPAGYKHVSIDELDAAHLAKRAAAKRAEREKRDQAHKEKRRSAAGSSSSRHSSRSSNVAERVPT